MRKHVPNKQNWFIWLNAVFLIYLLFSKKANPETIVLAYFLETIVIGIVHVIKMSTIIILKKEHPYKYLAILFFIFHYGAFVAVQLLFVFIFIRGTDPNIKELFHLIENISYILSFSGMFYISLSIILYNFADYYFNFLSTKRYQKESVGSILTQPYKRIFIQQFSVILAGFFMFFSSEIFVVAVLIILTRSIMELHFIAKASEKINPTEKI